MRDTIFMYKILVIERELGSSSLKEMIEDTRITPTFEEKNETVLQKLQDHELDAVFIEIDMPEMIDFQIIASIKAQSKIPVIAIIPAQDNIKNNLNTFGLTGFMTKPLNKENVKSIFTDLINGFNSAQEDNVDEEYPLHESVLEQLEEDLGTDVVVQLIESFLTDTSDRVNRIVEAAKELDLAMVQDEAHSLKSSSGSFGAMPLHEFAKQLEQKCKEGDESEIHNIALDLEKTATDTFSALEKRYSIT